MKNVSGLIFDLDHTLYKDPEQKNGFYGEAAVEAAMRLKLFPTFELAAQAVHVSVETYKSELTGLILHHGADRSSLYVAYHEAALPKFIPHIQKIPGMDDLLKDLIEDGVKISLLTHSVREWAMPLLEELNLSSHFRQEHIFCLNDPEIAFRRKDEDVDVFKLVGSKMALEAQNLSFFDDSHKNLIHPHSLGMTTVEICWDKFTEKRPYVHHQAANPHEFLLNNFIDKGPACP